MRSRIVAIPLAVAAIGAIAVPVTGAGAVSRGVQPHRCGSLTTSKGLQVRSIVATRVGCKTGKAVARRATGKRTYKASGFTCHTFGTAYVCARNKPQASITFTFKKRS